MVKRAHRYGPDPHHSGRAVTGGLGYLVVPADRGPRINLRSVACPDCQAAPYAGCTGRNDTNVHPARRRLATRAMNAQREALATYAENLAWEPPLADNEGRCAVCGVRMRLTRAPFSDEETGVSRGDLVMPAHWPGMGTRPVGQYNKMKGVKLTCPGTYMDPGEGGGWD